MNSKKRKYAEFLLKKCLSMNTGEPLLLMYLESQRTFADIIKDVAKENGITEIYEIVSDAKKTKKILLNSSLEEISKHPYFDRTIIKDVYDKGGSLLSLSSYEPSILKNVDSQKKNEMNKFKIDSQKDAVAARGIYKFPWCIAAVSTKTWADELFPGEEDNVNKLWNLIFKITLSDKEDPIKAWNEKIKINTERKELLNKLKLKTLRYKNKLGTDLEIGLVDGTIWQGAAKKDYYNKKDLIVNIPTEEVFTTPNRNMVNGVVVSSKPLQIRDTIIDEFKVTFENGKVVKVEASNDDEKLLELLEEFEGMRYLGECALVDYHSPISETNLIFKNTLIDENASCHLAFGRGFPITIPNGTQMNDEELLEKGMNQSKNHVDFMIGTDDLNITGTDIYGNEVQVFVDGDFASDKILKFIDKRKAD